MIFSNFPPKKNITNEFHFEINQYCRETSELTTTLKKNRRNEQNLIIYSPPPSTAPPTGYFLSELRKRRAIQFE